MNIYFKQALTFGVLSILLAVFASPIFAATYGTGDYSEGVFNTGETQETSTNSNTSVSSSEPTPPGCNQAAPGSKVPWLYAASPQGGSSILLYFTDADDPVSSYVLQFGTESGNYTWGLTDIGGKGIRTFLVESLQANTTYYFRVRAGNGCAPGGWSNEISAKTMAAVSYKQLKTTDLVLVSDEEHTTEVEIVSEDEQESEVVETAPSGYTVEIEVKDDVGKPVGGANVAIHSKVQETTTDENGLAVFENVEPGEHRVLVSYDGYEGEQSIQLTGDNEKFNLTITVKKQNVLTSPLVIALISGLTLIIITLVFMYAKKSR